MSGSAAAVKWSKREKIQHKRNRINWSYYYDVYGTLSGLLLRFIGPSIHIYIKSTVMLLSIVQLGIQGESWWWRWRELYMSRLLKTYVRWYLWGHILIVTKWTLGALKTCCGGYGLHQTLNQFSLFKRNAMKWGHMGGQKRKERVKKRRKS